MLKIFKFFLEHLLVIKDELTFWAFFGLLAVFSLYLLLKNPKWFELNILAAVKKLTIKQYYNILRYIVFIAGALLILILILTFASPIILRFIKQNEGVSVELNNLRERLSDDERLKNALYQYELGKYEDASVILSEVLDVSEDVDGLAVRAYFKIKRYDDAARAILEREKRSGVNDCRYWADFGSCIRRYALNKSVLSAISLINDLKKKYDSDLLSYIWTVLPIDFILCLEIGIHRVSCMPYAKGLDKSNEFDPRSVNEIKDFIDHYPDDKFISLAYYYLSDYDTAIRKCRKDSYYDISDLCYYGWGYDAYVEIHEMLRKADQHGVGFADAMSSAGVDSQIKSKIVLAKKIFLFVVDNYQDSRLADDAAVICGLLESKLDHVDKAFKYFSLAEMIGNKDMSGRSERYSRKLYSSQDIKNKERIFNINRRMQRDPFYGYDLAKSFYEVGDYIKAEAVSARAKNYLKDVHENDLSLMRNRSYENMMYINRASGKLKNLKRNCATMSDGDYMRILNEFKNKHNDYRAVINIANIFIEVKPKSSIVPNIIYSKIRSLVCWWWREDYNPYDVYNLALYMYKHYPDHKLTDDALAEALYSLVYWADADKASENNIEYLVKIFKHRYSLRNAADNFINIYSEYLYREEKYIEGIENDKYLYKNYRGTRFASYAESRIKKYIYR